MRTYHAVEAELDSALSKMESTAQTAFPFGQVGVGKAVGCGLRRPEHHSSAGGKPRRVKNSAQGATEHTADGTTDEVRVDDRVDVNIVV